jgi:Tfp pilus assembly protein FimT
MNRLTALLCLLAAPALAEDYDTVNVDTSATNVTSGLSDTRYKSLLVENGGSNAIYCSRDPAVTTNTGHKVAASDGWRSFPYEGPLYCIAATAAQTGTARDLTIVWGSYQ